MPGYYYAVIFSSRHSASADNASAQESYEHMSETMNALAATQKGFIGVESARDVNGFGITVSYWESKEDIAAWKANADHLLAQKIGRDKWYDSFTTRVCKVEREYSFIKSEGNE